MYDPVEASFNAWDNANEAELERLPECDLCGMRITDEHFYLLGGQKICEDCMKDCRVYTEDYSA